VLDFMAEAADPISEVANAPVPSRVGSEDWRAFVATIGDLRAGRAGWPAELERARLWYEPHLDRIHEDAVVRRADLIQNPRCSLDRACSRRSTLHQFRYGLLLVQPVERTKDLRRASEIPSTANQDLHGYRHANEQIVWMLKGKMEFRLGTEQRVCGPGDVMVNPGGSE